MVKFSGHHMFFLTADNSLCSLEISNNYRLLVHFSDVFMYVVPPSTGLAYLYTNNRKHEVLVFEVNNMVKSFIDHYKNPQYLQINLDSTTEVSKKKAAQNASQRNKKPQTKKQLLNMSYGTSKIRDTSNFPRASAKLGVVENDDAYILAAFFRESDHHCLVSVLHRHPRSPTDPKTYDLYDYAKETHAFRLLELPKRNATTPIVDIKILSTGYSVKCGLLVESRVVHLIYFSYSPQCRTAGILMANKSLTDDESSRLYGVAELGKRVLAVYGFHVCLELQVNF